MAGSGIDRVYERRLGALVNSREHLESLVVAHETGYPSIQSYLSANKITSLEA